MYHLKHHFMNSLRTFYPIFLYHIYIFVTYARLVEGERVGSRVDDMDNEESMAMDDKIPK